MKAEDFVFESITKEYNESDKFSLEKEYDYSRFFYSAVLSNAWNIKPYKNDFEKYEEYKTSILNSVKESINNGRLENFSQKNKILSNETLNAEYIVKSKSKNKEKKYKELKVSDTLVDFIYSYDNISRYIDLLESYKAQMFHNSKKENVNLKIFEEEYNILRLLLKNSYASLDLLKKDYTFTNKAKLWSSFLSKNITIDRYPTEYMVLSSIDKVPEFTKLQIDEIKKYNMVVENETEKSREDSKILKL